MSERLAMDTVTVRPIARDTPNGCLVAWDHRMGPVRRPRRDWSHGLFHGDALVGVVATDAPIRTRVAGFSRIEAVELSRLCAARPDLTRVALRLWRAFVLPALAYRWALSYQDRAVQDGALYRFDGWVSVGRSRSGRDPRTGRIGRDKVIWGWCDREDERRLARDAGPDFWRIAGGALFHRV